MLQSDWSGEVVNHSHNLSAEQVVRLLAMTEVLRDTKNLDTVLQIKDLIEADDYMAAQGYWSDFSEDEQRALWVAPLYGGVFTTDERKALRPDG